MSDFVKATITFGVIISVKDKEKLNHEELMKRIENLIMQDTEWLGEPRNATGCIVSMTPKLFQITGEEERVMAPQPEEDKVPEFTVKAIRKGDETKLLKTPAQIAKALEEKAGYTLVLKTKTGGMMFASIETMIGREVGYMEGSDLITATVGGVHE